MKRLAGIVIAAALLVLALSCWRYEAAVSSPERPCHPVAECTLP